MNVAFINPFLDSILNVLSTMAMMQAKPGKPAIKGDEVARGDVTGLIGMTSEQAKGSLAITFTDKVIFQIAQNMLGDNPSQVDESITDLVGEITNMVCGGAKSALQEKGYDFGMAIPAVVAGKDHVISHKSKGPKIILPFDTDAGKFFVEVCFEE